MYLSDTIDQVTKHWEERCKTLSRLVDVSSRASEAHDQDKEGTVENFDKWYDSYKNGPTKSNVLGYLVRKLADQDKKYDKLKEKVCRKCKEMIELEDGKEAMH